MVFTLSLNSQDRKQVQEHTKPSTCRCKLQHPRISTTRHRFPKRSASHHQHRHVAYSSHDEALPFALPAGRIIRDILHEVPWIRSATPASDSTHRVLICQQPRSRLLRLSLSPPSRSSSNCATPSEPLFARTEAWAPMQTGSRAFSRGLSRKSCATPRSSTSRLSSTPASTSSSPTSSTPPTGLRHYLSASAPTWPSPRACKRCGARASATSTSPSTKFASAACLSAARCATLALPLPARIPSSPGPSRLVAETPSPSSRETSSTSLAS